MISVKDRDELDQLAGRRRKIQAAAPAPVAAPAADHGAALAGMQQAIATMAENVASVAQQAAKPAAKELEAIIYRDSKGRMAKVIITVTK